MALDYEAIINEAKNLPYVNKVRRVGDGVYIYGKENPKFRGSYRLETFIGNKEPIDYQNLTFQLFKLEAEKYYSLPKGG